jgi:hypothetical protein
VHATLPVQTYRRPAIGDPMRAAHRANKRAPAQTPNGVSTRRA